MKRSSLGEADGGTATVGSTGRNDPCPCGSGLKFKKCCHDKQLAAEPADRATPLPRTPPQTGARGDALLNAARAHWAAGRSAQAIAAYREIARLEPGSADANNHLGAALAASGALVESVASFQRAVELRPSFDGALRNSGRIGKSCVQIATCVGRSCPCPA